MAFAAIDNLWKGAAGQAIQNLNLMLGLDEGGASGLASRERTDGGMVHLLPLALGGRSRRASRSSIPPSSRPGSGPPASPAG